MSPNAWVRVDPSGDVTLLIEKADLGQGVWTGLAMILADEMEADWARVLWSKLLPCPESTST